MYKNKTKQNTNNKTRIETSTWITRDTWKRTGKTISRTETTNGNSGATLRVTQSPTLSQCTPAQLQVCRLWAGPLSLEKQASRLQLIWPSHLQWKPGCWGVLVYQCSRNENRTSPFCGLMMNDCVAPFTSRQYPSIRSAMFSAMVRDGAVTVRG